MKDAYGAFGGMRMAGKTEVPQRTCSNDNFSKYQMT
jgi:hypothetical protein